MTRRIMEIRLTYTAEEYVQYADNLEWHELIACSGNASFPIISPTPVRNSGNEEDDNDPEDN